CSSVNGSRPPPRRGSTGCPREMVPLTCGFVAHFGGSGVGSRMKSPSETCWSDRPFLADAFRVPVGVASQPRRVRIADRFFDVGESSLFLDAERGVEVFPARWSFNAAPVS